MKSRILILVFLVYSSTAFAGGGWTSEKGNGYFKLSTSFIKANSHFAADGTIEDNITIGFSSTTTYIEYGFSDKLTGILNFSVFARNWHNSQVSDATGETIIEGQAINGIGDFDIGVKYGIFKNDHIAFAGSILLGIPSGGKSGRGTEMNLQLGDNEFNQQIRFDLSAPFSAKKASFYANVYVGFNHRTKGFSEEFKWGAEFGAGLIKEHLWLAAKLDAVHSLKNGKTPAELNNEATSGTSLFGNDAEYISYSIEAAGKIYKGFGVSFNYSSAFSAKLILAAPIFTAGVFYDLKKEKE